eukprot:CAMPEP_0206617820 /NCGR_PEP_ID=MMETSP0325_2-20121206/59856_1 /ASSEMBLY_ACC=CAM_ASM_000347 /TAXON_ID=2866 /ORGANISM="Crypthecodinium cohnii, Strain Seligo" /LENGTH=69 /DNA_ID=CAMNT_0054139863 /DNA_START=116 /DNA_END=323 /DNA_ORIENTATION=-
MPALEEEEDVNKKKNKKMEKTTKKNMKNHKKENKTILNSEALRHREISSGAKLELELELGVSSTWLSQV